MKTIKNNGTDTKNIFREFIQNELAERGLKKASEIINYHFENESHSIISVNGSRNVSLSEVSNSLHLLRTSNLQLPYLTFAKFMLSLSINAKIEVKDNWHTLTEDVTDEKTFNKLIPMMHIIYKNEKKQCMSNTYDYKSILTLAEVGMDINLSSFNKFCDMCGVTWTIKTEGVEEYEKAQKINQ